MIAFVVLGGLITLGVEVRQFLIRDARFRIPGASSIHSVGLSEVNRTEVLPIFGEDIGRNIFFVPLQDRRRQLEAIPWVKEATVMRFLPDQLSVSIVERTPVAMVRQGNTVELADIDGVILAMPPALMAQHHYSFPVVTGIDSRDSAAGRKTRMAVYQRFMVELDQNQQNLSRQVSEIDLSDPEDLRATISEPGADILAHFGEDQFLHRLQIYKAHIAEWRQRYPRLIGVDLRYNGDVPLEMSRDVAGADPVQVAAVLAQRPEIPQAQTLKPVRANGTIPVASKPHPPSKAVTVLAKKPAKPASHLSQMKAAEVRKKAARAKGIKAQAASHKVGVHHATPNENHAASTLKQGN